MVNLCNLQYPYIHPHTYTHDYVYMQTHTHTYTHRQGKESIASHYFRVCWHNKQEILKIIPPDICNLKWRPGPMHNNVWETVWESKIKHLSYFYQRLVLPEDDFGIYPQCCDFPRVSLHSFKWILQSGCCFEPM